MSNLARKRALVLGCGGTALTAEEKAFFAETNPFGFILFARNIENPDQVRALTDEMRACIGDTDAPVLIDQEGGRVRRMRPPHWRDYPAMKRFGDLFAEAPREAAEALHINTALMASDLLRAGIDVNCAPVLDVPVAGSNDQVLGDRAFSDDPFLVSGLGRVAMDSFLANGVLPVIKHIPGHGRARCDSHHELPLVTEDLVTLRESDFLPFHALSDAPLGMTAHILFSEIDPGNPATQSETVIRDIVRGELGFSGLLFSDDISMKALSGNFRERTERSLAAGCDIILHCNGDLAEMKAVAEGAGPVSDAAQSRWQTAKSRVQTAGPVDREALCARLDELLGQ